jgi:nucleoside-diphosphate-sugar epimerase
MKMNRIVTEDIDNLTSANIDYEKFYGKTVLISGANGYVPAYFVHTFLGLNDKYNARIKVIALCRNKNKAIERFEDYVNRLDFELLIQDVCDPIEINEDIHIFIHAASPAGIKSRHDDPVNTFLANVKGAENMLNLAARKTCDAFLFLSSVDVYGRMDNNERLKEEQSGYLDPLNVRNMYSCGKRAAESLCKAYQAKYDLPVYIVRPFQIIGPGPALNDGRLHIDFISQILEKGKIVLKSDGSAVRTFMYITDAIKAMFYVILNGIPGEAYNIVSETGEASVRELADLMANNVTDRSIAVEFDYEKRNSIEVTGALSVVTGDSSKIRNLGWNCEMSVKEGSARMMKYYGICCDLS